MDRCANKHNIGYNDLKIMRQVYYLTQNDLSNVGQIYKYKTQHSKNKKFYLYKV